MLWRRQEPGHQQAYGIDKQSRNSPSPALEENDIVNCIYHMYYDEMGSVVLWDTYIKVQ